VGPDGGAAAHIGDNQYFGVVDVRQLRNLTAGTVAVWAKRDSAAGVYSYILDCGFTFPATNGWTLGSDTGNPTKLYVTDAGYTRQTVLTFNDYQNTDWHHYAFTWAGTNCIGYFDGLPFQTNALPASVLTLDPADWLAIGAIQHNGTPQWGDDPYPNAAWLNGSVTDIRIYNTALSASDILNVYYVAAAPQLPHPPAPILGGSLPPQLLMHLTFQNWFGRTNVLDSTTNHADAIASGTRGPTLTTGPFGTNAAAHFATSQWLAVTKVSLFDYLSNGTLAVWISFDNTVGSGDYFAVDGWYAWPNTNCFWLAAATGNQTAFRQFNNVGSYANSYFGDWGSRGTWHHYGVTWNGTDVILFQDGAPRITSPQVVPFFHAESTAGWLALGVQHGSHPWNSPTFGWLNGSLADVRIYNYALTASDMQRVTRGQEPLPIVTGPARPRALRVVTTSN
jgi:hypothetical protein